MDRCPVCGMPIENTATFPYLNAIYDSEKGEIISGTCIHGVSFGEKEKTDCEKCEEKYNKCPLTLKTNENRPPC